MKKYSKGKKYSFRERKSHHVSVMRSGFKHGGKLNKKESYSAGFVHWNSDSSTYNNVISQCNKRSFELGERAGVKAYNKAMDYKF